MADNEAVSIADSDSAVAGASVAITEAEEDRTLESLQGEKSVTSSSSAPPAVNNVVEGAAGATTSSITATDASVAGSSVAVTEVEEDILCSTTRSTVSDYNNKKVILTKDSSLDLSICNQKNEDDDDDDDEDANNEEDLAPMHLHALRSPAKLKGAPRSRSSSRSRPGSRKTSPQLRSNNVAVPSNLVGTTISPSPSVGSSLDGSTGVGGEHHVIDPDLLLDKLGLRDLDANASHDEIQEMLKKHISSNNGLPTLNERLSEATLDDVHAFQDLVSAKKATSVDNDGDNSPGKAARDSLMRASQGPSSKILEVALDALTEEDEDD
ncbi:hypothetical protein QTG54_001026 [Skeletonema marinoi]|uniref:Uncharacterized protein n=1 Tax=Skeletonema marinoi TaxID=267567 RepID=A0AAD8YN39_9STRA|nr:hypothetical protein QTG54_001026 [Skeletonema marinoi]